MCSENGIGGNLSAFDIKQFRAPSGAGIARRQAEGSTGRGEPVLRPARRASLTINRGRCQWLTKAAGSTSVVSDDHHAVDVASFSREVGVCFELDPKARLTPGSHREFDGSPARVLCFVDEVPQERRRVLAESISCVNLPMTADTEASSLLERRPVRRSTPRVSGNDFPRITTAVIWSFISFRSNAVSTRSLRCRCHAHGTDVRNADAVIRC